MSMEFISVNVINTTTQISVNSNTSTASNLFNRDPLYQYYSDGLSDDLTTGSITITFDQTTAISRIALLDTNYKQFSFYYDGTTTNSFTLSEADTTTSSYTSNADTDKYFRFTTVSCQSVTIKATKTQTANQEKRLGLLIIADLKLQLTFTPSAQYYKPQILPQQIVHKLSDGGTRIHNVKKKWATQFSLDYVSESQRDSLFGIFDSGNAFVFCPFGTATGWDAGIFEAVWAGPFTFYEYSENAISSGFSGKIDLKETPT